MNLGIWPERLAHIGSLDSMVIQVSKATAVLLLKFTKTTTTYIFFCSAGLWFFLHAETSSSVPSFLPCGRCPQSISGVLSFPRFRDLFASCLRYQIHHTNAPKEQYRRRSCSAVRLSFISQRSVEAATTLRPSLRTSTHHLDIQIQIHSSSSFLPNIFTPPRHTSSFEPRPSSCLSPQEQARSPCRRFLIERTWMQRESPSFSRGSLPCSLDC